VTIVTPLFHVPGGGDLVPSVPATSNKGLPAPDPRVTRTLPLGGGASKSQPLLIPGQSFYLGERKLAVPICRDEVAETVEAVVAGWGAPVFTVNMVYAMLSCGSRWSRATVAKTMLRMTRPAPRPPYLRLERAGVNQYRYAVPM
jgi:hypothetical protein